MTTGLDAAVVREETKMKQENGRTMSFDGDVFQKRRARPLAKRKK